MSLRDGGDTSERHVSPRDGGLETEERLTCRLCQHIQASGKRKHTVIQHTGRVAMKRNLLNRSLPPPPSSSPAASIARDIEEFTLRVAARQGASYVEARLQGVASIVIVNPARD